jgi:phage baseplate assembly protein W
MAEKSIYNRVVIESASNEFFIPGTRTYKGMSSVGVSSGSVSLYDINLIKQDLINHFYIRQGEKLGNPEFGCIIWDVLFDPLTEELKNAIAANVQEIVNYDPRISANDVIVSQYENGLQIECELTYLPYNIAEAIQFRFDKDNSLLN